MGRLYVLAEMKSEIHLLALKPATGDLVWSQTVAAPQLNIVKDPYRRWAGMSPVYADGILVCPTCSDAVVGYDLATRSFSWGYHYGETSSRRDNRRFVGDRRVSGDIVTIRQRRVMLAPSSRSGSIA